MVIYVPKIFLCFNLVPVISLILLSDDVTDGMSHHHQHLIINTSMPHHSPSPFSSPSSPPPYLPHIFLSFSLFFSLFSIITFFPWCICLLSYSLAILLLLCGPWNVNVLEFWWILRFGMLTILSWLVWPSVENIVVTRLGLVAIVVPKLNPWVFFFG